MKSPIILIGVGEMGGVFARGLLRAGYPVYPVVRGQDPAALAEAIPNPAMVLLAVGEKDLQPALEALPDPWRPSLALLQNELLPRDWQAYGLEQPTVISVWFEKKPGRDPKVIIPSPAYGARADLLRQALATLDIPVTVLATPEQLLHELVLKNLYILTTNIAGLKVGGTVGELWAQHRDLALAVADDVLTIQQALTGVEADREALVQGMVEAFEGDLQHNCMGRSAPARLARALEHAAELGVEVPTLRQLHERI